MEVHRKESQNQGHDPGSTVSWRSLKQKMHQGRPRYLAGKDGQEGVGEPLSQLGRPPDGTGHANYPDIGG